LRADLSGYRQQDRALLLSAAAKKGQIELHKDKGGLVETIQEALGLKTMRVVETGGTDYMRERTQWDSGANLVCSSIRDPVDF
jgi:arginine deiminase